jgi:hypothetical protein
VPLSPADGVPGGLLPLPASPLGGVGSAGERPFVCAASGEARNTVVIAIAVAILQVIGRLLADRVRLDPTATRVPER